jgi:hypothetical protein
MSKMDTKDFKYYKDTVEEDIREHDSQLEKVNCPSEVILGYNGRFKDSDDATQVENYLFVSAATILPSLYYQMPRINVRSNRESLRFEAAVLTSLCNSSFVDKEKEENQLCIVDAFLPYGYAVMKNGYNSRTGKTKDPSILTGESKSGKKNDMEGDVEYIKFEKAISIRQSPKFTYLDSSQPFGKGNRITFCYDRTLRQIKDSNLYDLSANFLSYYGSKSSDDRKVKMKITEHWCMISGYAWKLSYVEGWDEPLAWLQTEYTELPVSYLRFNKVGDVLYSISHGTLGLRAQKELNYLNELWKKHIDNMRNQHLVYEEALSESGKKTLKQNDIGGIVGATKPVVEGIATPLQSATVDPALFGNIQNVRQYLQLILSTTGGKTGGPEAEFATTEKAKALGDVLRSSGMQDAIRDFMIAQIKQRIKCYLKFGTPEMIIKLSGEELTMPLTGKPIEANQELALGGDSGLTLPELITGNIDLDFLFDVDIQSAARPDYPVIRKQLAEGIGLGVKMEPLLRAKGKKINLDLIMEDYFKTFDSIPNADKYIADMSEQEKQMMMQTAMAGQMGEPPPGTPEEGAIARGAENVQGLPPGAV